MSTSTAEYDAYLIENWDTETLIIHLKEQNLKLDDDDFAIIRKKKISGLSFLELTKDDFMQAGLEMGPAILLAKEVKALKTQPKRSFSSFLSLSEVLSKYSPNSDGIDSIPLFEPQIHEIQDNDKHFKHCMAEILVRLRSYGTLQPDSLEAIRNEYVVAILHTSLHITMDETKKELIMRPQHEIIGEESKGRVDYAIKEAEDLICITEDKQHKVPMGFAQNIKQLESSYETNRRKRKRDEAFGDDFDYLYGIVTTGRDWHFLLYSPGEISKASDTAYTIEFSKKALEKDSKERQALCESVKEVLSVIVGLLKDRACADKSPESKRVKIDSFRSKK